MGPPLELNCSPRARTIQKGGYRNNLTLACSSSSATASLTHVSQAVSQGLHHSSIASCQHRIRTPAMLGRLACRAKPGPAILPQAQPGLGGSRLERSRRGVCSSQARAPSCPAQQLPPPLAVAPARPSCRCCRSSARPSCMARVPQSPVACPSLICRVGRLRRWTYTSCLRPQGRCAHAAAWLACTWRGAVCGGGVHLAQPTAPPAPCSYRAGRTRRGRGGHPVGPERGGPLQCLRPVAAGRALLCRGRRAGLLGYRSHPSSIMRAPCACAPALRCLALWSFTRYARARPSCANHSSEAVVQLLLLPVVRAVPAAGRLGSDGLSPLLVVLTSTSIAVRAVPRAR